MTQLKNPPFPLRQVALASLATVFAPLSAQAAALFYDGFSAGGTTPGADQYVSSPTGGGLSGDSLVRSASAATVGDGQMPATYGFSTTTNIGGWRTGEQVANTVYGKVLPTGLTYAGLSQQTGAADIFRSNSSAGLQIKNYSRAFQTGTGAGAADLYFSSLMQFDSGVSGQVGIVQGNNILSFGFNATGNVVITGSAATILATSTTTYAGSSTYMLVAHVYGANLVDIYLNPTDLLNESANSGQKIFTGLALNGFTLGTAITDLRLTANTGASINSPDFIIDEVHGGTTWAEAFVIPEPATASLALLGGFTLLRRRRK